MEGGNAPTSTSTAPQGESGIQLNQNYASQYNPMSGLEPLAILQQYRSGAGQGISPMAMMQQYQQSRSMPAQFAAPVRATQQAYAPYVPPPAPALTQAGGLYQPAQQTASQEPYYDWTNNPPG